MKRLIEVTTECNIFYYYVKFIPWFYINFLEITNQ